MGKVIILSRVSTESQNLEQQTQEILKQVYKDGYTDEDIIIIEDKESAIKLSEEERNGINRLKMYIESNTKIDSIYIYELSRLSRRQKFLFSLREYLIEKKSISKFKTRIKTIGQ
jgi:DNA invertase Pin-like site-specific DNA recombinase